MSNGAILNDLGARFKMRPGDDMFAREKLSTWDFGLGGSLRVALSECSLVVNVTVSANSVMSVPEGLELVF